MLSTSQGHVEGVAGTPTPFVIMLAGLSVSARLLVEEHVQLPGGFFITPKENHLRNVWELEPGIMYFWSSPFWLAVTLNLFPSLLLLCCPWRTLLNSCAFWVLAGGARGKFLCQQCECKHVCWPEYQGDTS